MQKLKGKTDDWAESLARNVIQYRWWVILASLALLFTSLNGARFLEFSSNYRVYFSDQNPELRTFENFQATYTKNDNILFVLKAKEGTMFTQSMAEAQESLTKAAWQIPYSIRVDSITNFQHSWADGDDLTVEDLIHQADTLSYSELQNKKSTALSEPLLKNSLISPDASAVGVNVTLNFPEKSLMEVPTAVAEARKIVAEINAQHPDIAIALSGLSMMNNAFAESSQLDMQSLVPLMYAVMLIVMIVVLRSFSATFSTLLIIAFSTLTAMGMAGYLGIKLSPPSASAPTIILTLAIADSIHILVSVLHAMREGKNKTEAIVEGIRVNFLPVSITSLTTIIGFMSLNFSDSPPFWDLGNITAIGIAAAWLYSITFLPALLSVLPVKVKARKQKNTGLIAALDKLALLVTRRYRTILVLMTVVTVGLITQIPKLELNDEFVKYFDHRIQFRGDAEFSIDNLTGLYLAEYSVGAKDTGGISDPEYLQGLEKFVSWLRQQPEVMHVYSYTDIIKRLNKNMNADDSMFYRMPQDRELAAQYLLLYEMSLPYGQDLNDRINVDKSATRVTTTLKDISTIDMRAFLARAENWMQTNLPPYMQAKATGASVMFSYISERNIDSMLYGNILAVLAISVILMFALRSFRFGALSILPNVLPIAMMFGVFSLISGWVGMAAATVTATSLGIVVDDTVHFFSKYLRARREKGLNQPEAIRYAFRTVGVAILFTTVILTLGFAVLMTSSFLINSQSGLLTAIAIVCALVFDFLMLPALLMLGYKKQAEKETPAHLSTQLSPQSQSSNAHAKPSAINGLVSNSVNEATS